MSDHGSGPRAFADPVIDITDLYAFPSPQQPGVLVLVLNVFPAAAPTALFSDAVDYRLRLRPVTIPEDREPSFTLGDNEITLTCRFAEPMADDEVLVQEGSCTVSSGHAVSFRVNDEQGSRTPDLRVFAGVRLDPFFFDGARMALTLQRQQLSFEPVGRATVYRQNVLAIVVELNIDTVLGGAGGPLFAVVGETAACGPKLVRFERYGRPEIKNFLLGPKDFDPVNRTIELRDLYNQEDAFGLGPAYQDAYRTRMNANLHFLDGLDGKTDWPPDSHGIHPLTELLLADFMVVDVSQPFSDVSYMEVERQLLNGAPHQTCGGRSLNEDSIDSFLTVLINNGNGAPISDGVDTATVPAADTFPYLAQPEQNPPKGQAPAGLRPD